MSQRHFVIVNYESAGDYQPEDFRLKLNRAIDWIELSPGCWLLWTSSSSKKWLDRLKPLLSPADRIVIFEVNPNDRAGVTHKSVWKFIRDKLNGDGLSV